MCRRVAHQFSGCGHRVASKVQRCGRTSCSHVHEDQLGDPGYACTVCEKEARGKSSAPTSTSSQYSHARRMSLDPAVRQDLRLNLVKLGSSQSQSNNAESPTSTYSANFGQTRPRNESSRDSSPMVANQSQPFVPAHLQRSSQVLQGRPQVNTQVAGNVVPNHARQQSRGAPVSFPPPPPNVRQQGQLQSTPAMSRAEPVNQDPPSAPVTPRARRHSTRQATWIGSPVRVQEAPAMPVMNSQFIHPGSPQHRRQNPSYSSPQGQGPPRGTPNGGNRPQMSSANRNSVSIPFGTQFQQGTQIQQVRQVQTQMGRQQSDNQPQPQTSRAQFGNQPQPQMSRAQFGNQSQQRFGNPQQANQRQQSSGMSIGTESSVDLGWPENPQFGHERSFYHDSRIW